jgi:hypothetical protein
VQIVELVQRVDQQQELVAADAGQGVAGSDQGAHPLGHRAQQRVAHRVAVEVVDLLEVVQVDEGQRHQGLVGTLAQRLGHDLLHAGPVGQAGELVHVGAQREFALVVLALGDVAQQRELHRLVEDLHRLAGDQQGVLAAVDRHLALLHAGARLRPSARRRPRGGAGSSSARPARRRPGRPAGAASGRPRIAHQQLAVALAQHQAHRQVVHHLVQQLGVALGFLLAVAQPLGQLVQLAAAQHRLVGEAGGQRVRDQQREAPPQVHVVARVAGLAGAAAQGQDAAVLAHPHRQVEPVRGPRRRPGPGRWARWPPRARPAPCAAAASAASAGPPPRPARPPCSTDRPPRRGRPGSASAHG